MVFRQEQLADDLQQGFLFFTEDRLLLIQQSTWDSIHLTIPGPLMLNLINGSHICSTKSIEKEK